MQQTTNFSNQFQKKGIALAIKAPWRITNELRRLAMLPYIRLLFALHGVSWGQNWRIFGMPLIQRHHSSTIMISERVTLRSWPTSNPLVPNHSVVLATRKPGAIIQIGDDCGFTGTTLVAAERIQIGNRVQVGANSTIVDTDFHPLTTAERTLDFLGGAHMPIVIEDDVFIGMHCLILKGVTIGQGSVVGAGSVVTRDVPSRAVVAGNPARVVKQLEEIE